MIINKNIFRQTKTTKRINKLNREMYEVSFNQIVNHVKCFNLPGLLFPSFTEWLFSCFGRSPCFHCVIWIDDIQKYIYRHLEIFIMRGECLILNSVADRIGKCYNKYVAVQWEKSISHWFIYRINYPLNFINGCEINIRWAFWHLSKRCAFIT